MSKHVGMYHVLQVSQVIYDMYHIDQMFHDSGPFCGNGYLMGCEDDLRLE